MKKLALLSIVVAGAVAGYRHFSHAPAHHAHLVQDRAWLDHMPRNDRDTVNVFAVLTQQPVGVFQAASFWKGSYEAFRYEQKGDEIRMIFPQTGDKESITVTAYECSDGGFDYCLDVKGGSHGVKRYYSREEWVIDSPADLAPSLQNLLHGSPSARHAAP
ncbi:MAG TPA: hypothetical protein VLT45_23925 [Kofleriaceae bacterium]|nr:hypothetical protein [Kofleriaceae bacterium]